MHPALCCLTQRDKREILAKLQQCEATLRSRGVAHAALFGSRARGDHQPDSDIDLLIEIAPEASVGLFEYVAITQYLEDLFPAHVDIANRARLKATIRAEALRDAVYAF
jgi:predicted nucleotidyltransferase